MPIVRSLDCEIIQFIIAIIYYFDYSACKRPFKRWSAGHGMLSKDFYIVETSLGHLDEVFRFMEIVSCEFGRSETGYSFLDIWKESSILHMEIVLAASRNIGEIR
jgi:hypothetical protein